MADPNRQFADIGRVPQGARQVTPIGAMPTDVRGAFHSAGHAGGRRYVSDTPYEVPYNERPTCVGVKKNGEACKAKARAEGICCDSHVDQE